MHFLCVDTRSDAFNLGGDGELRDISAGVGAEEAVDLGGSQAAGEVGAVGQDLDVDGSVGGVEDDGELQGSAGRAHEVVGGAAGGVGVDGGLAAVVA